MQCSNCRFENMPGIDQCGRCGASLRMAAMAVDVYPPRAGRWSKFRRQRLPSLRSLWRSLNDGFSTAWSGLFGELVIERPAGEVVRRMVAPGWPQIYCGHSARGRLMLGAYCVLMLAGLPFIGTHAGAMLWGLAFACHASSIVDVVFAGAHGFRDRVVGSLSYLAVVCLVLYVPAGWLVTRIANPQRIVANAPPFHAGDVLLNNRSAYLVGPPRPGDVVLYEIPRTTVNAPGAALYMIQGLRVDRVLAGPGQRVVWEEGRLFVDGAPSDLRPLNPARRLPRLEFTVPDRSCLVFPSTDLMIPETTAEEWRRLSVVPVRQVRGRVYLRRASLAHWEFVR